VKISAGHGLLLAPPKPRLIPLRQHETEPSD